MTIRRSLTLFLLLSLLALSGCVKTVRQPIPVPRPQLPPVPAPLMQPLPKPLQTACKLQSLLFAPATKQTPENVCSALK